MLIQFSWPNIYRHHRQVDFYQWIHDDAVYQIHSLRLGISISKTFCKSWHKSNHAVLTEFGTWTSLSNFCFQSDCIEISKMLIQCPLSLHTCWDEISVILKQYCLLGEECWSNNHSDMQRALRQLQSYTICIGFVTESFFTGKCGRKWTVWSFGSWLSIFSIDPRLYCSAIISLYLTNSGSFLRLSITSITLLSWFFRHCRMVLFPLKFDMMIAIENEII